MQNRLEQMTSATQWTSSTRTANASQTVPLEAARDVCRRLASSHYENFTVVSRLVPKALRPHFCHIYAYCRTADDLADEAPDRPTALAGLDAWEAELDACYRGRPRHPVFVALAETIAQFEIPDEPFRDLLSAFRQDQHQTRYATVADVLDYCRRSANPVGRLVLSLGRCTSREARQYSDSICTGLQLANFCQDVSRDWQLGRIYLPAESCRAAGYEEAMFATGQTNPAFRRLMTAEVDRGEKLLLAGRPILEYLPRELRPSVWLFAQGGLRILREIRRLDYDVWSVRPTIGKAQKLRLLTSAWLRRFSGNWKVSVE